MSYKKSQGTSINKTLVAQIIFIVAVVSAIFLFERFSGNEAALLIDFDDMKRVFAGEVVDGMTVLDALNASVAAGQIKLVYYVDDGNNTKVKEISDHSASGNTQFTFYVNSRKLDSSELNKTLIKPGDEITIKLE